eukprot:6311908-Prymnesium_polylepis.1
MATMAQSVREGAKCARAPVREGKGEKFAERTVEFEAQQAGFSSKPKNWRSRQPVSNLGE